MHSLTGFSEFFIFHYQEDLMRKGKEQKTVFKIAFVVKKLNISAKKKSSSFLKEITLCAHENHSTLRN